MKPIAIGVSVVVLVFGVAVLAKTQTGSVEQELIKLENDWNNAWVKADVKFLDQTLAADYILTDSNGILTPKAELLARLKSGEMIFTSAMSENLKVSVYGDAAVVRGLNTEKSQNKGKDTSGKYQWTDTWIKIAGRWQCVATHASMVPQK